MMNEDTWKAACRLAEARGLVVSPKTRWFTLGIGASRGFAIMPRRSWSWRVQTLHKHVALWERCKRNAQFFDATLRAAPLGPCGRVLRWGEALRPLADFRALELAGHAWLKYPRERGYVYEPGKSRMVLPGVDYHALEARAAAMMGEGVKRLVEEGYVLDEFGAQPPAPVPTDEDRLVQERREEAAERLERRAAGLECPSCSARLVEPHWDRYAHYRPCGCAVEVEVEEGPWHPPHAPERVFFARQQRPRASTKFGQLWPIIGIHPTREGAIRAWRELVAKRWP